MKEPNILQKAFNTSVNAVYGVILIFIMLGIGIGAIQLFGSVWELLSFKGITGHYIDMIADVLTLYVLVELAKSLTEYFTTKRLRLTFIIDAAIVFVIREMLIGLFKHELKSEMIYALSAFLLVLAVIRFASIYTYQLQRSQFSEDKPSHSD